MTAAAATLASARPVRRSRVLGVVRLHLVDGWNYLFVPWIVTGAALLISIVISIIIARATGGAAIGADGFTDGAQFSGAGQAMFWYLGVIAIQTINLALPFALGLSVTRREFLLGTGAIFLGISLINSALYTALGAVEELTGGWWVGTRMFTSLMLHDVDALGRFAFYVCLHLVVLTFGAAMASVFFRWRALGTTIAIIGLAFVLVGAAALLTFTDSWPVVGDWYMAAGTVGLGLWTLPVTAVCSLATWALLSRATPKG